MATEAQVKANRRNAKRSTGRTRESKAVASRNAITHGLLAQDVVLEDEDGQLFQDLLRLRGVRRSSAGADTMHRS